MRKSSYIYIGAVLLVVLASLLITPRITGEDHYILSSKEDRLAMIEMLKQDCRSQDITYLIVTYKEKFHDFNASQCWNMYMRACLLEESRKLDYRLHRICPEY